MPVMMEKRFFEKLKKFNKYYLVQKVFVLSRPRILDMLSIKIPTNLGRLFLFAPEETSHLTQQLFLA